MGIISFIATFLCGVTFMLLILCIIAMAKDKEPKNNVHFYMARDKDGSLWLYIGKPVRKDTTFQTRMDECWTRLNHRYKFEYFGLNEHDYDNLKWEDEPVEVFLNLKD